MKKNKKRLAVGVMMVCLALAGCGKSEAEATTMHLVKAEGTVGVTDKDGKEVSLIDQLGLYSGYELETRGGSYAWIDLDRIKLAKMDQETDARIEKKDKNLEIQVTSGNLFFHVTEALSEEETFDIRSSTMMVGIRGTCGWVEAPKPDHMKVYILEGTVECSASASESEESETASVIGGEMAEMSVEDGHAMIRVESFTEEDIPAFVLEELYGDEELCRKILEEAGLDVRGIETDTSDGQEETQASAEPLILTDSMGELEYITGADGVVVTMKNGLYGMINFQGEEIVSNEYPMFVGPGEGGIVGFGDEEQCTLFDREGNEIVTIQGIQDVKIADGMITYSRTLENGTSEVGCYDIAGRTYAAQISTEDPWVSVTPAGDGVFYYFTDAMGEEGGIYRAATDGSGSVEWMDQGRKELWEQLEASADSTAADAGSQRYITRVDGSLPMVRYYAPYGVSDGYLACLSREQGSGLSLFDCSAEQYYEIDMTSEEAHTLFGSFESYNITGYYYDGRWRGNLGTQVVLSVTYEGQDSRCFLLDFSRAELDEYRYVTNLSDVIVAEYPSISLSADRRYLAGGGTDWFYLDEKGQKIDMPEAADCSGYYGGYAMLLDMDGMAYMVDRDFQKITDGYPADGVLQVGEIFLVLHGAETTVLYMP